MRTLTVIACWWLLSAAGLVHAAGADAFPVKSIRIVVPFPAGGTTDILARSVAQALGERLDVTTFVENRAGASGTIGSQLVATSPADGSVLLLTATHHVINPSLFRKLPYDTRKAGRGDAGDSRIARHQANIRNPGSFLAAAADGASAPGSLAGFGASVVGVSVLAAIVPLSSSSRNLSRMPGFGAWSAYAALFWPCSGSPVSFLTAEDFSRSRSRSPAAACASRCSAISSAEADARRWKRMSRSTSSSARRRVAIVGGS
jgi:hypothetical protein